MRDLDDYHRQTSSSRDFLKRVRGLNREERLERPEDGRASSCRSIATRVLCMGVCNPRGRSAL